MAALNVLDCLCHNVRKASRLLTQYYDDALRPSGIRITQFTILETVSRMDEAAFVLLASVLGMDRTTLSRNIEILQRDGLVAVHAGVTDKRRQVASLTSKGATVLGKALPLWEAAQRKALKRLERGAHSELLSELTRLSESE